MADRRVILFCSFLMVQVASTIQLDWTGALKNENLQRHTISAEFLEPFSSGSEDGSCVEYLTCLACLTDTACGWCDSDGSSACVSRRSQAVDQCITNDGSLVTVSAYCPVCADHVDCTSCTQVGFYLSHFETNYTVFHLELKSSLRL